MSRDRERPAGIAPVPVPEAGSAGAFAFAPVPEAGCAGAFAPLEASILLATPCSSRSGPEPAVQLQCCSASSR